MDIQLDDGLVARARVYAARSGTTLDGFISQAVEAQLINPIPARPHPHGALPVVAGTAPPNIEVGHRRRAYQQLGER